MKRFLLVILIVLSTLIVWSTPASAAVWYVYWNRTSDGDGTAWSKAFRSIGNAIWAASAGDEIWVATGIYPHTYDLIAPLTVNKAVKIYGGFYGNETELSQRNPEKYETTIEMVNVPKKRCFDITADATIDGFTIAGARASGTGDDGLGGAIFITNAKPIITNCVFRDNQSETGDGGAIYVKFSGGATIKNSIFTRNHAGRDGGALYNTLGTTEVTNCTFYNNSAVGNGGALYTKAGTTTVTNCILWQDHGMALSNQEIYNSAATVTVSHSIVDQDGYAGSNGNLRQDPRFLLASADNFRLRPDSPAVDAGICGTGTPVFYTRIAPTKDFEGDDRPAHPTKWGCDIGADEYTIRITVNTVNDEVNSDGDCSLREAIKAANTDTAVDACPAGKGFDIVRVPAGIYQLTIPGQKEDTGATGDLDLEGGISLIGDGQGVSVIDGGALDRVIDRKKSGLISRLIDSVILSDLTVRNGLVTDATNDYGGGGVRNWSVLLLENVELTGNVVTGDVTKGIGGAISTDGGDTTLVRCSVHHNQAARGAGIFSGIGDFEMRDSVVYENTAEMHSALVNGNGSHKTVITGSTFSRNTNTAYPANGVIYLSNFVNSEGHVTLTNVTVSGNTGSGIEASGAYTTMNHCTVAGNSKYGLLFSGGGLYELTLRNSILSGNSPNCGPTSQNVTSAGFNIDSSSADCLSFNKPGDMRNTDPKLRPLDNYGGLTLTHNLFSSSPAVNAADSSDCPATDQRGRPRPFGAGCDIGAVEYDGTGGPPPKPTPWLILLLGD